MKIVPLRLTPPVDQQVIVSPLAGDDEVKPHRLPRWTKREILVLIEGKRIAESLVQRGSKVIMEPKWSMVSSYCRQNGVDRGPLQCRKRWGNLGGDFKRIREYEAGLCLKEESFWGLTSDLRRVRRLPGFFDREVYHILCGEGGSFGSGGRFGGDSGIGGGGGDGGNGVFRLEGGFEGEGGNNGLRGEGGIGGDGAFGGGGNVGDEDGVNGNGLGLDLDLDLEGVCMEVEPESVFDSGWRWRGEEGLFSHFGESGRDGGGQVDKGVVLPFRRVAAPTPISVGTGNEKEAAGLGSTQDGKKRKCYTPDEDVEPIQWHRDLIKALERNGNLLSSQLEVQNNRYKLEKELQKDHAHNLASVLGKVADALGKIADKL